MSVLPTADAYRWLFGTDPDMGDDLTEVEAIVAAAERAISGRCGDLEPTTHTEVVTGNGGPLILRPPVISITSITLDGAAQTVPTVSAAGLSAGIVPGSWTGDYTVVYVSGRTLCPPDLLMGVKELVRHLWDTTRRSAADRRGQEAAAPPASTFVFPHRVEQWIAPYVWVSLA